MALKKLKFNMIFGGSHYTFGTVLEESVIPLNLRKTKYLLEPGPDPDDYVEEMFDEDEEVMIEEEEFKPPRSIKKKLR